MADDGVASNRAMTISMKKTLSISLLLASAHFCLADQVCFNFDASTAPVYDVTGEYLMQQDAVSGGQTLPVAFYLGVNHEGSGRIRSSGSTILQFGTDYVAALYDVVGSVSGGDAHPIRVNFSARLRGYDWIAGEPRRFSVSLTYHLTVNAADATLDGNVRGSVSIHGVGSGRVNSDISVPLPADVDGSWKLTLNVTSLGSIGGTGTFAISDFIPPDNPAGFPTQRLLPATAHGSYSQRTGSSKVSVHGIYDGRGSNVSVTYDAADNTLQKLSGKVMGQAVRVQQ